MPKATNKRKGPSHLGNASKRTKPDRPYYMTPLSERRSNPSSHSTKKDGTCRKDCRECKSVAFDRKALDDPDHVFHALYLVREKGRNGSPTYDQAGYEMDYDKVSNWFRPTTVRSLKDTWSEKGMARIEKEQNDEREMLEIFFEPGGVPPKEHFRYATLHAARDRVEKDLKVPWHRIGVEEFRMWGKKGFTKAKKGEYQDFSKEEQERLYTKSKGSAFRK